jgi:chromosome segregation ATPase
MSIVSQVIPYEILFRFKPDGTLVGCHRRDLKILVDESTGEVHSAKELDPQPIVGEAMEAVLGNINMSLIATTHQYQDQIAQLGQQSTVLQETLGEKEQELVDLGKRKIEIEQQAQQLTTFAQQQEQLIHAKDETLAAVTHSKEQLEKIAQELGVVVQEQSQLIEINEQQIKDKDDELKTTRDEVIELRKKLAELEPAPAPGDEAETIQEAPAEVVEPGKELIEETGKSENRDDEIFIVESKDVKALVLSEERDQSDDSQRE